MNNSLLYLSWLLRDPNVASSDDLDEGQEGVGTINMALATKLKTRVRRSTTSGQNRRPANLRDEAAFHTVIQYGEALGVTVDFVGLP